MIEPGKIVTFESEASRVLKLEVLAEIKIKPTGWRGKVTFRDSLGNVEAPHIWVSMKQSDGGINVISRGISDSAEEHQKSHFTFRFSEDTETNLEVRDFIADWIRDQEEEAEVEAKKAVSTPEPAELPFPTAKKKTRRWKSKALQVSQETEKPKNFPVVNVTVVKESLKLLRTIEYQTSLLGVISESNLGAILAKEGVDGIGSVITRIQKISHACNTFQARVDKILEDGKKKG